MTAPGPTVLHDVVSVALMATGIVLLLLGQERCGLYLAGAGAGIMVGNIEWLWDL